METTTLNPGIIYHIVPLVSYLNYQLAYSSHHHWCLRPNLRPMRARFLSVFFFFFFKHCITKTVEEVLNNGVAWITVFHTLCNLNLEINRLPLPVLFLQQTGLYEYKVFGVLEDCSPELLADVYMDLDYRKQWDEYVKGEWHLHF